VDGELFTWVVVPFLIFLARLIDVPLGTLRILFLSRGVKLAALVGFFEVLVWLLAIGQIMNNLTNPMCYVAYSGGFALGNLVGLWCERKIAFGTQVVRVITRGGAQDLIEDLRANDFGVTNVPAEGLMGTVHLIYTVVKRRDVDAVLTLVRKHNPRAFCTVEDVTLASQGGIFPASRATALRTIK